MDPLLEVLLKELPEESRDLILGNPEITNEYLDQVRSLTKDSIEKESSYFTTSYNSVNTTLISLAQNNHSKFISSYISISKFESLFNQFEKTVTDFYSDDLAYLNNLRTSSKTDIDLQDDNERVVLLKNLDKVQDILELPSLARACVRNGYYSEALDLASLVNRLIIRYEDIAIIRDIQREINDDILKDMTVQLLKLIRDSVKFPVIIKVMAYLRRMPPFSTLDSGQSLLQLQQLYIASRLHFIRVQISTLTPLKQSPHRFLKRYIEIFREHVFATVVGFKSVFPERPVGNGENNKTSYAIGQDPGDMLMSGFLRSVVKDLYQVVAEISPYIDDTNLRSSLWLQIAYCSQSLGRIGADFWPAVQHQGPIPLDEWNQTLQRQREISQRLL